MRFLKRSRNDLSPDILIAVLVMLTVADVGLILALVRSHHSYFERQRNSVAWEYWRVNETRSSELPTSGTVLITGFEPFMRGPVNASWEAVKNLDGEQLGGFTLKVARLRVVWGSPKEQLDELVRDSGAVAVFSFGQGHPGEMALETRAQRERGNGRDNLGIPGAGGITDDGPDLHHTRYDAESVRTKLRAKGWPVRVSTDAGQYLCEENLYVLMELERIAKVQVTGFCHLPPLGTMMEDGRVADADLLGAFVRELVKVRLGVEEASQAR